MGIKTRFNPMGGPSGEPYPDIPEAWSYTYRINETGKNVRTLYFYNNTVGGDDVVTPYGYTELQDYITGSGSGGHNSYATLPFYNHRTITRVNLNHVPFRNNSMLSAFSNCVSLESVEGIPEGVTRMNSAFYNCARLNQNVRIPNSARYMVSTFSRCTHLNHNIQIPNSVVSMDGTFQDCYELNQSIQVPRSVCFLNRTFANCRSLNQNIRIQGTINTMESTFSNCSNLNQDIQILGIVFTMSNTFVNCSKLNKNIQIPKSVYNMYNTFEGCSNLNQNIRIPDSVRYISGIFSSCSSLNQNIQIPGGIINMSNAFYGCSFLAQNIQIPEGVEIIDNAFSSCASMGATSRRVDIRSTVISSAAYCFATTGYWDMSKQLTLTFPMRTIDNVNTTTRDSLVAAGYAVGTGIGITSANTTYHSNVLCWDLIPYQGYDTYVGNGTHWTLTKWGGRKGELGTDVQIPTTLTTYDTFPTAYTSATFAGNAQITNIDCNKAEVNGTTMQGAFKGCSNVTNITNLVIPDGVTTVYDLFTNCFDMTKASSESGTDGVGDVQIPESVTNAGAMYARCTNIHTIHLNGMGVTALPYFIDYCNTRNINMYIKSPNVTTVTNFSRGYVATYTKNIYIPYMNDDGTYTKTYNSFYAQTWSKNLPTTGFYMYDTSPYNSVADYIVTRTEPTLFLNTYRGLNTDVKVVNASPFSSSDDVKLVNTCFTTNTALRIIDCNNVPFVSVKNAFAGCQGAQVINNVNIADDVTDYSFACFNCRSLEKPAINNIPNGVTTTAQMYDYCANMTSMPANIGYDVTQMRYMFRGCTNIEGRMNIFSPKVANIQNTFVSYSGDKRKDIYIYFHYANGVNTATYNQFKANNVFKGTSGNAAGTNPMYNSTSNFYIHDLGPCPI